MIKMKPDLRTKYNRFAWFYTSLLVVALAMNLGSLSCKSPSDTPLQENTEIELIGTQEEKMLREEDPFSTDELFLWKKHLGYSARFSENTIVNEKLYFYDPDLYTINKLSLSNGEIEFIGKEQSYGIGGITFPLDSSIIRMYTSQDHEDGRLILDKVSLPDLEIQWQHTMDHPRHSDVTLYEDMILYGSFNGYIYALDIENGSLRWRFSFEDAVGKGFYPYYYEEDSKVPINISSDLYIRDNILYCYYNGYRPNHRPNNKGLIYAIDLSTKRLVWKTLLPNIIRSDIFFDHYPDGRMLYVSTRESLYEIVSKTGQFIEIPLEEIGTNYLVGLCDDYFIFSGNSTHINWVSRSDFNITQREYQELQSSSSARIPLWYRNIAHISSQIAIDDQHYQQLSINVLINAHSNRDLVMLDLNSGDIIFHWINTNTRPLESWVDAFRYHDIFIAWDGFGIYALDLKKVFIRWIETKEPIVIMTGKK